MASLAHSPADIIQQLLIDMMLASDPEVYLVGTGTGTGTLTEPDAWPVYSSMEPDVPDDVITITDQTGLDHGRLMLTGQLTGPLGFQVRIRSREYSEGWLKANDIRTTLSEQVSRQTVIIGGVTYFIQAIVKFGNILHLGKEIPNAKRDIFTLNAMVAVKRL